MRALGATTLALVLLGAAGCATPSGRFYWGDYEESLYVRQRDGGDAAQTRAAAMLERTIARAEKRKQQVGPGVYADYGYLLFRQGRTAEAVGYFHKEAETYPEARRFMNAVVARIERTPPPPPVVQPEGRRSILVVPPLNHTTAVDAPILFNTTITRPLAERGYYVFPIALTTGVLQDLGLTDEGLIAKTDPTRFREVFGADSVLFVTIKAWTTTYLVLASSVAVEAEYRLVDTLTGETVWQQSERVAQDSRGGNNFWEVLIGAALHAAVTDYRPLARQANGRVFDQGGLPPGPYR